MVSEKQVFDALREVIDPEIGLSIVELGLVYGVKVEGSTVKITMTLTAPACPLSNYIVQQVREKAESVAGVREARVELVSNPPWTPDKMSEEAKKKLGFKTSE